MKGVLVNLRVFRAHGHEWLLRDRIPCLQYSALIPGEPEKTCKVEVFSPITGTRVHIVLKAAVMKELGILTEDGTSDLRRAWMDVIRVEGNNAGDSCGSGDARSVGEGVGGDAGTYEEEGTDGEEDDLGDSGGSASGDTHHVSEEVGDGNAYQEEGVESLPGELIAPAEDGLFGLPFGAAKMEVGISFPSKRAAAGGELNNHYFLVIEPNMPTLFYRFLSSLVHLSPCWIDNGRIAAQ